jgi:hypothetical protein
MDCQADGLDVDDDAHHHRIANFPVLILQIPM